jgi:hypothetical protein
MAMNNYGIVLFHTNSSAIQAEFVLTRAAFPVRLVPTPREYSSDCGVALRFDMSQHEKVQIVLEKARVEVSRIVIPAIKARAAAA